MKSLRSVFFLVGVAAVLAVPAVTQAQVEIIQTNCTPLSTSPPQVEVTFAVLNLGPIPVCSIHMTPVTVGASNADSCRILACSNAPGWTCQLAPGGGAFWHTLPGAPCIGQSEKHEPFDVVLDPLYCCYRVEYDDPSGAIFFTDLVCFECDKATGRRGGTWGRLKMMYR
jgi:hypothetical protein